LNEYKSDQSSNKHLPITEVLRPLKYLPETKNVKLILLGLGTFQKLLNNQIIFSVNIFPISLKNQFLESFWGYFGIFEQYQGDFGREFAYKDVANLALIAES